MIVLGPQLHVSVHVFHSDSRLHYIIDTHRDLASEVKHPFSIKEAEDIVAVIQ